VFVCGLAIVSSVLASRDKRWEIPYYTVLAQRIALDGAATAEFRAAGMPRVSHGGISPELERWLEGGGRRFYESWVIRQPKSYADVWSRLRSQDAGDRIRTRYFENAPPASRAEQLGNLLWQLLAPPPWLWLGLLFIPLLEGALAGRMSHVGALACALVPITFVVAFGSFHAAGTETVRHMLGASLTYRIASACGLAALLPLVGSRLALARQRHAISGETGANGRRGRDS